MTGKEKARAVVVGESRVGNGMGFCLILKFQEKEETASPSLVRLRLLFSFFIH